MVTCVTMSESYQLSPTQSTSSQIVSGSITVPLGHVVAADAWRGTQVVNVMAEIVQVLFCDDMGVVDFMPSEDTAVLFISEADLLAGPSYKRRIARFRHNNKAGLRGVVLVCSTSLTHQQYSALQTWAGVDLELTVLSVSTLTEAGRLLAQFACCREKMKANPFRQRPTASAPHAALLSSAGLMPGLGPKRAQQVLATFDSLCGVANASPQQLGGALGNAGAAQTLHRFLHEDTRFT